MHVLYIHPAKQEVEAEFGKFKASPFYPLIPVGVVGMVNLLRAKGWQVQGLNFPLEIMLNTGFNFDQWLAAIESPRLVMIDLHWYEHSFGAIDIARHVPPYSAGSQDCYRRPHGHIFRRRDSADPSRNRLCDSGRWRNSPPKIGGVRLRVRPAGFGRNSKTSLGGKRRRCETASAFTLLVPPIWTAWILFLQTGFCMHRVLELCNTREAALSSHSSPLIEGIGSRLGEAVFSTAFTVVGASNLTLTSLPEAATSCATHRLW